MSSGVRGTGDPLITLEELGEHLDMLESLRRPDATLKDILLEVKELTGADYDRMSDYLGWSRAQVGRICRGEQKTVPWDRLRDISDRLSLPFETLIFANGMSVLSDTERRRFTAAHSGSSSLKADSYLKNIRVPFDEYHARTTDRERRQALMTYSSRQVAAAPLPAIQRSNRILVENVGEQMEVTYKAKEAGERFLVSKKHIPDRAIVEVEIQSEEILRTGDIVLAQLSNEESATFYLFEAHRTGELGYELYRPLNQEWPLRVRERGTKSDPPFEQQRALFGRALRIVSFDVTQPDHYDLLEHLYAPGRNQV